jgi:putative toxin-antitoxin system antitoxin component (TIGR02293 family)
MTGDDADDERRAIPLTHGHADRAIAKAIETFGTEEKAAAWLRRPTAVLDGHAPIERLDTETGCREVETALGRIAHGIAV